MLNDRAEIVRLIETCRDVVVRNADYLCELDRAIGDGDHGTNMARGLNAVFVEREHLSELPFAEALSAIGNLLVMHIGGASGPLYGTLLLALGTNWSSNSDGHAVLTEAVDAVAKRGKSNIGDKTLLDVLYPLLAALSEGKGPNDISSTAWQAAHMTIPMRARRGRASYLGERSIGHMDPGAASIALLVGAICDFFLETEHLPKAVCA